ncbi:MAG: type II toxin-antitoxin system VapC family toxin [Rubrivivax sp.]
MLWFVLEPGRLTPRAARLLADRAAPAVYSLASIWEVAIKTSLRRPGFDVNPDVWRKHLMDESFTELPISPSHIARAATLPWLHRYPFDRMLIAQALEEGLTLLSANAALKGYGRFVRVV